MSVRPCCRGGDTARTCRAVSQPLWCPEQALERRVVPGLLVGFKEVQDIKGGYDGGSWWGIPCGGLFGQLSVERVRASEVQGFGGAGELQVDSRACAKTWMWDVTCPYGA